MGFLAKKISYTKGLAWIVGSAVIVSFVGHRVFHHGLWVKTRMTPSWVSYIVQTGPQKEALRSDYLAEKLSLSADQPVSFTLFDPLLAKKRLESCSMICEVEVKKLSPNMVYVDYAVRKPFVWAADYENAILDREGVVFPAFPFFSPKKMTRVYFGEENPHPHTYGDSMQGRSWDLAKNVISSLQEKGQDLFFTAQVDISHAWATSLGKREIVVSIENEVYHSLREDPCISIHFLRLTPKSYDREIAHYITIREHLLEAEKQEMLPLGSKRLKDKTIDLRLAKLAYIAPADG